MKKFLIFSLIATFFICFCRADARILYVKPTGNNSANGLSWANAWQHPNKTNGNLSSGDTVLFAPATYDSVDLRPVSNITYACSTLTTSIDAVRSITKLRGTLALSGTWTSVGSNRWRYNGVIPPRWNAWDTNGEIGHMILMRDGVMQHPTNLLGETLTNLDAAMEFYYKPSVDSLYVYGDPTGQSFRYGQAPVVRFTNNTSNVKFIGITLEEGYQGVVLLANSDLSALPDSVLFLHCNLFKTSLSMSAANLGIIFAGGAANGLANTDAWGRFNHVEACSLDYAWAPADDYSGGGGVDFYSQREFTVDSSWFGPNLKAGGLMFKYGGTASSVHAYNNTVAFNTFEGGRACIWWGPMQDSLVIIGNIFKNAEYRGIDIHSTPSNAPYIGRIKILNNTFWNCGGPGGQAITISPTAGNSSGTNEIKYNVFFDTTSAVSPIGFVFQSEAPIQSPPTESYWQIDYNMYYTGSTAFSCAFISGSGCTGTNWASWQACGFDTHGLSSTNPLFAKSGTPDLRRPLAYGEMSRTYNGKTWTTFGAIQNYDVTSHPHVFCVRQGGSNSNDGKTMATAWAHPNYTNSRISAGDTVYFVGAFDTVDVRPPRGGTAKTLYKGFSNDRNIDILCSGLIVSGTWTQFSGQIYRCNTTVPVRWNAWVNYGDGAATQDGLLLDPQTSTGSMYEGSCYYNQSTNQLYVWCRGGGSPSTRVIKYSQSPVIRFYNADQDSIIIDGLTLDMGYQAAIILASANGDGNGSPDGVKIINCNLQNTGSTDGSNNQALIYAGNNGVNGNGLTLYNDTLRYSYNPTTVAEHAGAGLDLYTMGNVVCSTNVFIDLHGTAVNFKNGYGGSATINNCLVANNKFIRVNTAIRVGPHTDSMMICGNYFIDCVYRGADVHSSSGTQISYTKVYIQNNTFYNSSGSWGGSTGESITLSAIAAGNNYIRYNIIFDTTTVGRCIGFNNQEGYAQTPITDTYYTIDYNMYYLGASAFSCVFQPTSGCSGTNWAAWQACHSFDIHGTSNINPNFLSSQTPDLSRPSAAQEMNQTYAGKTWTLYGAWQPGGTSCTTLAAPTLVSPANAAADLTQPISIDWADVAGATNYELQIDDNSDFSSTVTDVITGTSNYSASGLANNTTYYWKVRTQNACGWGSWSSSRSFTTLCVVPSLPTLSLPANGATSQSQPVVLDWTDASNATSYDVQIDNNSDFSSPTISTNVSPSTYNATGLAYSTTYYWRIRAQNACGNSGYTSSRSFTTGTQPPAADSLIIPIAASSDDGFIYYDGGATAAIHLSDSYVEVGNGGPEAHTMIFNFVMTGVNYGTVYDTVQLILVRSNPDSATTVNSRIYVHDTNNSPTFSTLADYNARSLSSSYVDWNSIPKLVNDNPIISPNLASIVNPLFSKSGYVNGNRISIIAKDNSSSFETYRRFLSRDGSSTSCAKLRLVKISLPTNIAPSAPSIKYPYASKGAWINPYITVYNSTDDNADPLTYSFEVSTNSGFTGIVASANGIVQNDSGKTSWRCSPNLSVNTIYYVRARAYDGTDYSSWSPTVQFFTYPSSVTLVNQTWHDTNNGVMSTANQTYVMTENINTTKWGFIIRADGIKFDMNHYTLTYDNKDSVGITNPSFEIADTDTNNALGWNMGASAVRRAGNYLMEADYGTGSPSLYSGNYALAVAMPRDSSLTTTSSLYTFAGGYRYNVSVMCYNHYANSTSTDNIAFRIRLINASGNSVYMGTMAAGRFYRGFVPICVEFYTDTTAQYRIGLEVVGGAAASAGYVYFDDARIQTDCYHGIAIGIDTTRNNFQTTYITGNNSSRIFHNSVYQMSAAKGIDGVLVENGTIIQGNGRCFNSMGVYIGLDNNPTTSPCANDTVYNVNVIVKGPASDNVVVETSRHRLSNMTWLNYAPFGTNRNTFPIAYVRADYSPYSYGIVIDSSYGGESNGSGIVMQTRCDSNGDGIDNYPLNKIYGVTLQTHTKYTNGFAIMSYGSGGIWIDSSFVYNDTGQFYGLGIQLASETSTCEQRPKITRSIVRCRPDRWSQEYVYYLAGQAKGIQLDSRTNFVTIEDCSLTVYSDDYYYDIGGITNYTDGVCIRINGDAGNEVGAHINRCKLTAIARGNDAAQCINWYTSSSNTTDSLSSMLVENSTFVTNDVWLGAISFSYRSLFLNNTFQLDSTVYPLRKCSADHINGFVHNDQNTPVQKIRIIGNRYPDQTTERYFDSLYVKNSAPSTSTCSASREASYYFGYNVEVLVLDGISPESGAIVEIRDKNNNIEYIDTTTIYGYANTYAYEYYDSSASSTRNVGTDRINLNPHTINVTSGSLFASTQISIVSDTSIVLQLSQGNTAPVLASIGDKSVTETNLLSFSVTATDADGDIVDLYASTLPSGAIFTDNNDNSGAFSWTPDNSQSGTYPVTFYANDGFAIDQETITITVNDLGNQPPVINGATDRTYQENTSISFDITVTDQDNTNLPISIQSGLPSGATFTDHGNGVGTFSWVPSYTSANVYPLVFYTTDGVNPVTANMILTITDANRPPTLSSIGDKTLAETELIVINVTATDPDVDNSLLVACTGYPAGAIFSDNGSGNAQLGWNPQVGDAGTYPNITFTVTDGHTVAQETITITVTDVSNASMVVIQGTNNVEDTWLRSEAPTLNYGGYSQGVTFLGYVKGYSLFRFKNISSYLPANAIITNSYMNFYSEKFEQDGTIYAYRVFKPWVEGDGNGDQISGATYNMFALPSSSWGSPGCSNASDAGSDNATSGSGFDREATSTGSLFINRGGYFNLPIQPSLVQKWRTGEINNNGILLNYTGNIILAIYASENPEPALRPKLIIQYTLNEAPIATRKTKTPLNSILSNGGVI